MKKRILAIIVSILLIASSLVIVSPGKAVKLSGDTLYVGGSGPGNYTRIQDAIDNASEGDTVFVYNGTYYEELFIDTSITLQGENANSTIIEGKIEVYYNHTNICCFSIRNRALYGQALDLWITDSKISTISHNIISDSTIGIHLYGCKNVDVKNNYIFKNEIGVSLIGGFGNKVSNNNIFNNKDGISLDFYCISNLIESNNIISNDRGITGHSFFNRITSNNLINNSVNADIVGGIGLFISIFLVFPFSLFIARPNIWSKNYWSDWDGKGPMVIKGEFIIYALVGVLFELTIPLPIKSYDWSPAKEPYDINRIPEISNPNPSDNQENIPISLSELSFQIYDDSELMDYSVITDPFIGGDSKNGVGSGIYTIPISGLQPITTYSWTVTVTDGLYTTTSTFKFKTAYIAPFITDPYPSDGAINVPLDESYLSFSISDPQNDLMSYSVETSPDIGEKSETNVPAGRYEVPINNLENYNVYSWYVNVTDGEHWTREKFKFSTLSEDVLILYPSNDTMIIEGNPNNNYGSSDHLNFRSFQNGWNYQDFIKFNLSQIPSNAEIAYAKMYLYYYKWEDNNPGGDILRLYKTLEDWSEDTVTWNNQPSVSTQSSSESIVPNAVNNWMTWDVTEDVISFISGDVSNFGWMIKDDTHWSGGSIPFGRFYSKEYGDLIPYIEIGVNL